MSEFARNRCSRSIGIGVHVRSELVFTFNRNRCSRSIGIGVHVQSESVFTFNRNMHNRRNLLSKEGFPEESGQAPPRQNFLFTCGSHVSTFPAPGSDAAARPLSVSLYFWKRLRGLSGRVYSMLRSRIRNRTTLLSWPEISFCPRLLDSSTFDIAPAASRPRTFASSDSGRDSGRDSRRPAACVASAVR